MVPVSRLRQVAGGVFVALGGVSLYAAWVLTRRTVFEYVHLGGWGVLTGVVLIGVFLTVTFGGVVALSRGYRQFVAREDEGEDDALRSVASYLIAPPMSRLWKPLVALGVVLWTVLFITPEATESVSAFEPLAVLAWVLVPFSVRLDAASFDAENKMRTRAYVIGSLFPFFAAVVGATYLFRTLLVQ